MSKFIGIGFVLIFSVYGPLTSGSCVAQSKSLKTDSAQDSVQESAQAEFVKSAAEYRMHLAGKNDVFKLNSAPILKWTNPARTRENGAVFLWMKDGRPEVIGCCFTYEYDNLVHEKHELHTLSTKPIEAEIDGSNVWKPKPVLTFTDVPNAPKPAANLIRNKLQMRSLSRKFSATLIDRKAGTVKLRLMPTALTTYEPKDHECKAGGIFSFAYGTDPEVLLILEVREVDGKAKWQYAFARFHYFAVNASLDGKQVWKADLELEHENNLRSTADMRDKGYVSFHVE